MDWLGLSGGAFLSALLGLGGVVVLLYLLKEQRRRVTVPALALWESLLRTRAQAALSTRLRRVLSLLLALAILTSVLFALADLRRRSTGEGRSVLVLIDRSASMAARDEPNGRLAKAKTLVERLLPDLPGEDDFLIATLDQTATPLCTWTRDPVALRSALARVSQSDLRGDLVPAIEFALNALRGRSRPELYIVSDGNLEGEPEARALLRAQPELAVHYLRVGKASRNVGITGFAVRSYPLDPRHFEGVITLQNFGEAPEQALLKISAGDTPLYEEQVSLKQHETAVRTLADLPWTSAPLQATLSLASPDFLGSDDRAQATLPEQARLRVLAVSAGNRYLEAALLLDEYLEVVEQTPAQYQGAAGFEVVIFDGVRPQTDPMVAALYLGTGPEQGFFPLDVRAGSVVNRPFFDRVDRAHPALRQLALRDVNLARALRAVPDKADRVLAATAEGVPLIVEGSRGAPFMALTFDVRESDLPLRPAWPLLLLRSLERLANRAAGEGSSHAAGALLEVDVPADSAKVTLHPPRGASQELQVQRGRVRFVVEQAGLYRLQHGPRADLFAVNVDSAHEGAIAPRPLLLDLSPSAPPALATASAWPERLWPWFVGLAALLLVFEWVGFHRRWTV